MTSTDALERSFNVSRDFTFDLDLVRATAEVDPFFNAVWQRATKYAGCDDKEVLTSYWIIFIYTFILILYFYSCSFIVL